MRVLSISAIGARVSSFRTAFARGASRATPIDSPRSIQLPPTRNRTDPRARRTFVPPAREPPRRACFCVPYRPPLAMMAAKSSFLSPSKSGHARASGRPGAVRAHSATSRVDPVRIRIANLAITPRRLLLATVRRNSLYAVMAVGLLAIPFGSALHTFHYAQGASYLSDDPTACANCHVMRETFDDWVRGEHAHAATCNDCHVPRDWVGKWYTKAENGWSHSLAMTRGKVSPNIAARVVSRQVALENCVACHAPLLGDTLHGGSAEAERLDCLQCHRSVGHPH